MSVPNDDEREGFIHAMSVLRLAVEGDLLGATKLLIALEPHVLGHVGVALTSASAFALGVASARSSGADVMDFEMAALQEMEKLKRAL